ncbi:amino acid/amide ABC transporter ATP-binding protein 1, HAAT family [Jatrophihabitans endophyticus]|uniref:Amino acid/amide ABC transporter ATP-binding protein 1, HAAT family n=1 Tax=Jatrophihabitans endophyticus TaxID=1206085 RepID=A0A1M5PR32_9ACTN|nr:ABC transporter ATP-binding protein [Jatrophihabitans endophyticus]SHH04191.1 amino acid/amide ABC transporter ATP-binding protein 1, HAAT family [Jatrophihabitans endophyticus]
MSAGLVVRGLTVRYGGITAVEDVDLGVPADSITGLIGPNGAGKSSLFNACAGTVRASAGTVELFGRDISRIGPARRAQAGLGRTFQRVQLFRTLTVRENVALGHETAYARSRPWSLFHALPSERRKTAAVTAEVLEHCGLTGIADKVAGGLSTGEQRMVELARALASPARMLLLDEPSSGLSSDERGRFTSILTEAVEAMGRGVFVVEHDMDLVAAVCQRVYVLNFGHVIFSGSMAEALRSDVVRQSYLGTTEAGASDTELEVTGA